MIGHWHRAAILSSRSPVLGRLYGAMFAPVALIGVMHLLGGLAVLINPEAASVSGLSGLMFFDEARGVGIVLVIVGLMALAAKLLVTPDVLRLVFVLPQQAVLMLQFGGVVYALVEGRYPDGYTPSSNYWSSVWFIFGDQIALIVLCLSHTVELVFLKALRIPTQLEYARALLEKAAVEAALAHEQGLVKDAKRLISSLTEVKFWEELGDEVAGGQDGQALEREEDVTRTQTP